MSGELRLYEVTKIDTFCSQTNTKHINTVWAERRVVIC